jgi:hypothetical protein
MLHEPSQLSSVIGIMNMPNLDRDYPYQVELPPVEDATRLDRMKNFCATVNYRMRTEGTRYRWCFANEAFANWFQSEFGGRLIILNSE